MFAIYNLLIRIYYGAILFASLFHWKAKLFIRYRRNWKSRLEAQLLPSCKKILMICPSIGEFQECRSFIDRITKAKSNRQFIYAFHSPSGFDQATVMGNHPIRMMLPMDCRINAIRLYDLIKPEEVYVLSTGLWHYYIREAVKRNIPHYLVSFQGWQYSSLFHPCLMRFYGPLFRSFKCVFCYTQDAQKRITDYYGCSNVVVCGNLRYDSVIEMKKDVREIRYIDEFTRGRFCIVAGSTEKREDELLAKAYRNLRNQEIKWIIVPHEKLPGTLRKLNNLFGHESCFYSTNFDHNKNVLIYDITGDLFQLYRYADLCLVGRGFEKTEIHNMLEPAVFFKPVLIGPMHKRFDEPKIFIKENLAFEFKDETQLTNLITEIYTGKIIVERENIQKIFEKNQGGTDIVMNVLNELWMQSSVNC